MSLKTVQIIAENDSLKQKISNLKLHNSLLSSSEKELAKKSTSYQKSIQMMYKKLKESDQILELAFEENALFHELVPTDSQQVLTEEMMMEISDLQDDYNQLVERMY